MSNRATTRLVAEARDDRSLGAAGLRESRTGRRHRAPNGTRIDCPSGDQSGCVSLTLGTRQADRIRIAETLLPEVGVSARVARVHDPLPVRRPRRVSRQRRVVVGDALQGPSGSERGRPECNSVAAAPSHSSPQAAATVRNDRRRGRSFAKAPRARRQRISCAVRIHLQSSSRWSSSSSRLRARPDKARHMALHALQAGARSRRAGSAVDAGNESISVAGNRDDVVVLIGTLTERSPQRRHLTDEVVLLHGRVGPHQVQQLILADDVVSMLEQHDEHVEGLGRDGHETVVAPQAALDGIDDERTEGVAAFSVRAKREASRWTIRVDWCPPRESPLPRPMLDRARLNPFEVLMSIGCEVNRRSSQPIRRSATRDRSPHQLILWC